MLLQGKDMPGFCVSPAGVFLCLVYDVRADLGDALAAGQDHGRLQLITVMIKQQPHTLHSAAETGRDNRPADQNRIRTESKRFQDIDAGADPTIHQHFCTTFDGLRNSGQDIGRARGTVQATATVV
jgi:hypothetical protein